MIASPYLELNSKIRRTPRPIDLHPEQLLEVHQMICRGPGSLIAPRVGWRGYRRVNPKRFPYYLAYGVKSGFLPAGENADFTARDWLVGLEPANGIHRGNPR